MKLNQRLFLPTDNIGLVLFRIAFGFLMCFHCIDYLADGSVFRLYIEPPFTFNFIGFDFLQPLPGNGMYYYFGLMALLGILIMIGYRYRLVSTLFALLWTALYLMQKSGYNNHHYLVLLISWLMVLMPANRNLSVDAYLNKSIKTDYCEQWIYWLFIIQIGIVYFFAAASKLTPGLVFWQIH
jgi:vitamin K-dependent gamma-carboxylase